MKKTLRTLLFCAVLLCVAIWLSSVYGFSDNVHTKAVYDTFYSLPEDSVDVVWLGPSSVQEYFMPSRAYTKYGIATYGLANGNQPFLSEKYLIEECEKTQDPALYLVDIRELVVGRQAFPEAYQRVSCNMRVSNTWLNVTNSLADALRETPTYANVDMLPLYVELYQFHSRRNITVRDFGQDDKCYMGFMADNIVSEPEGASVNMRIHARERKISSACERDLLEFLDFCDSFDKRVVFTCTPNWLEWDMFGRANYAKRIIRERGYEIIDLNEVVDKIGLDSSKDVKNSAHVNMWGAQKVTDYIAKWMSEQDGVEDRREDGRYAMYVEAQERLDSRMQTAKPRKG